MTGYRMRSDDTRSAQRSSARQHLAKAREFHEAARDALLAGKPNAAGLAAIHGGISAADAALIASAGVRSASRDHSAVVLLLNKLVPEAGATQERQLRGILALKNVIAYEQRLIATDEARGLVENAGRLVKWAANVVSAHLD